MLCPTDKHNVMKNPWSSTPGCFTGSSEIVMREWKGTFENDPPHSFWECRLLTGVERMAMRSWCHALWSEPCPHSHSLLSSLAGNAFSLF